MTLPHPPRPRVTAAEFLRVVPIYLVKSGIRQTLPGTPLGRQLLSSRSARLTSPQPGGASPASPLNGKV